ncbi:MULTISPECIES: hypothetical protein [Cysteiniphilum]|uniref:Uncharacterized protein n=1 Tax=Cysteiniphilum litorale TaxID=2056700 RepID=A0A8J2Z6N6_9GAMM|nr:MULTISPECIES: hypothetical protein [Cysteiniphilum]GGG06743.1 hypothetical protein GCM10010995_25330 [Cysteiniphilum litorale]
MRRHIVSIITGLTVIMTGIGYADANFDKAMTYATVNTVIATSSAIALQKAGFKTQTYNTQYGLVTTIDNGQNNISQKNQNEPSTWQTQQEISQQRQDFMNQ